MNTDSYRNQSGVFPNPDALQEFSVQKSNFSAEYANATGAVVNAVTKSGTNQFHGSAFEFLRNGAFNARNFFAAKRDSLKRNQFGGTLGGPVRRTSCSSSSLTRAHACAATATEPSVPSDRGDARRRFLRHQGDQGPAHRHRFPRAIRFRSRRLDPVTQAFLKYLPDPGTADGSRYTGLPGYQQSGRIYRARLTGWCGSTGSPGRYFLMPSSTSPSLAT